MYCLTVVSWVLNLSFATHPPTHGHTKQVKAVTMSCGHCHTGAGFPKSRFSKTERFSKNIVVAKGYRAYFRFVSIGAVAVVLTGEIAAGLKHQYHTKLTS